ncbi:TRAP transporter substrate-binding protein DctP [Campylobacter sp. CN_NE4]|uniref:TRAP transporter substrate-binding protein n=1 Tax=unclassified Campylobacter TaxID=2593542 RepID=UPI0022E9DCBC|nr:MULTISPECIES: TRAP transporter substrate-binding protein DctP [unclassified Campylobacter]MDA3065391.1 TRAP transporter substrate-binding protein DctP [Campylobacter sp. CN_NE4]MDA3068217.1 TRAP transporter substrate-binding protein DctP [Campylobacter sp. CN_NE3]MDA3083418.1 TRAP transporter substrate-binding protein DctP [Campylobacter sp. CN_NE1]WBR52901.1 TRAP transporter substrate-binding protein DctP [Campylobacter sp. CN_NE2]
MKKVAIILAIFAVFAFGAGNQNKTPNKSQKHYILKLALAWENTLPLLNQSALEFKNYAEIMSGGKLKIQIYTPSQHKSNGQIFDFVKDGKFDLGYTALYYYHEKDPKFTLFTAVPFGMTNDEGHAWYYYGGGKELSEKMLSKYGVKAFLMGSTQMQMGGWFKKEINSLDDLNGLKVRITGFGAEVMSKLGVTINTVPTNELYKAFKMGTIDAVKWINPIYDMGLNLHKVADYYYIGWQEPSANLHLLANKKTFENLPKDLQMILETSARLAGENFKNKSFFGNAKNLEKLKTDYPNIQIKHFSDEIINAFKNATQEILEENSAKDPLFKEILHSQQKFQKIAREWKMTNEIAFLNSQNIKPKNDENLALFSDKNETQNSLNLPNLDKNSTNDKNKTTSVITGDEANLTK